MSLETRPVFHFEQLSRGLFLFAILGSLLTGAVKAQNQAVSLPNDPFLDVHRRAVEKNPKGVSFAISLDQGRKRFVPGELISVKYRFAVDVPNIYSVDLRTQDRIGRLHLDRFVLDHRTGVVDPLAGYFYPGSSLGGLGGSPPLDARPVETSIVLNQWFRFDRPGKFRLYVAAPRLEKRGERRFSGGAEVTSNIIEFEITPNDEEWATRELDQIRRLLALPENHQGRWEGCQRLRFLTTEAAAMEMAQRLGDSDSSCEHQYSFGLIGSPHRELIVKALERGLEAPGQRVTRTYLQTLAHLATSRTIKEPLEPVGGKPSDEFSQAWRRRNEAAAKKVLDYLKFLADAIPHKEGQARAVSLYTILDMLWNHYPPMDERSIEPLLSRLTPEIIAGFKELPGPFQRGLIGQHWEKIRSPAMLPLLRQLLDESRVGENFYDMKDRRSLAIRRIIEFSPDEKRRLLLVEIRRPIPQVNLGLLGSLPDETLPDLDDVFCENLERESGGLDSKEAQAWLIARYASPAAAGRVEKFYANKGGKWACSIQDPLLGYFLRVRHPGAMDRIRQALDARSNSDSRCYTNTLMGIAQWRTTPELEQLAIERLDDPDHEVVLNAAAMLGKYGSADAEAPLWRRLEKWDAVWKEKPSPGDIDADHPHHWERSIGASLRMALNGASAWLLDYEKIERLRKTCLTEHELQQFNYNTHEPGGPVPLSFYFPGYGWGTVHAAQYGCSSPAVFQQKVSQYPKGTVFVWQSTVARTIEEEQAYTEVKEILDASGMTLEKKKGPQ